MTPVSPAAAFATIQRALLVALLLFSSTVAAAHGHGIADDGDAGHCEVCVLTDEPAPERELQRPIRVLAYRGGVLHQLRAAKARRVFTLYSARAPPWPAAD